jgi:hypothetical protein
MTPEKGYVGVIARNKAGKGTVSDIIQEVLAPHGLTVETVNYSDSLKGTLLHGLTCLTRERATYDELSRVFREGFGQDILAREVDARARRSSAHIVVLAGMRRPPEMPLVRSLPNSHILYLTAPVQRRWEWTRLKNERPGDADKTLEQFLLEEQDECHQFIEEIGEQADSRIDNNGTLDEFKHTIRLMVRDRFGIE